MSSLTHMHLHEAERWANRAKENFSKANRYHDPLCRVTMRMLGEQAEAFAARAALLAAESKPGAETMLQTKSGLHPYRAALFFILRESEKAGPKSRAAVVAGDIREISGRQTVRMLAHMFDKSNREVARDLINTFRAIEDGNWAP
jgi:hypothetical protein